MGADEARELFTRAEMTAETGDLAELLAGILTGAEQAGADPGAVAGLITAIRTADPSLAVRYDAGSASDRRLNTGFRSEGEFLEAVSDAEDQVTRHSREAAALDSSGAEILDAALTSQETAVADLAAARERLSAAYAMPTRQPCEGCHGAKQAAIVQAEADTADAEARIADAREAITACEAAAEILAPLAATLQTVLACVRRVPHDLGEVYELVHTFIRGGGKLPDYARWIEGMARHGTA